VTVIALNRLGRSDGAKLVHRLAGNLGTLPPDVVDEIVERSDGVPLVVEAETAAVGTPVHFSVLFGLWVSNFVGGAIAAALEHATNFLSIAQSQPSSGPLLVGHRILAFSLIFSGDYCAALAHLETAASLYRPDEHRDSALRYGLDVGVSASISWRELAGSPPQAR
jgi:hypothetical protein